MATTFVPSASTLLICARTSRPTTRLLPLSSLCLYKRTTLRQPQPHRHVSVKAQPPPASSSSNTPTTNTRFATDLQRNVTQEEQDHYDSLIVSSSKDKQIRTPWHRADSHVPPVNRARSAGAMTKGKLLTTPTRLFKLILPLTTSDVNSDRRDVEPLALLVHPQQPLSYLERLIQSELPTIKTEDGKEKIPVIHFRAEDSMTDDAPPGANASAEQDARQTNDEDSNSAANEQEQQLDEQEGAEDASHTHLRPRTKASADELRGGPGEGGVESYSGLGRESKEDSNETRPFVRWSKSTEIGDFIRDAARGKEFAVEIEGAPREIRVGVPSFGDRTYYLRMRLRKKSKEIASLADIKKECDRLAELAGQRVAYFGFSLMAGWMGLVYYLTFKTELGWDVMEPVTYLVGLGGLLGGYLWFLLNKREASYRSAMNLTVSRRQNKLYEAKGLDLKRWEYLVEEANALRKEIIAVAMEYDTEYDEGRDMKDEKVVEALKEHRLEKEKRGKGGKEGDGEEEDEGQGRREPRKWEGARG